MTRARAKLHHTGPLLLQLPIGFRTLFLLLFILPLTRVISIMTNTYGDSHRVTRATMYHAITTTLTMTLTITTTITLTSSMRMSPTTTITKR